MMLRTFLIGSTIAGLMTLGIPTVSASGDPQNPISSSGKATKDAGKAVAKGTKGVAEKTVTETKNVGKRIEGAVDSDKVSARCRDGTVQTGKTKADACRRHRGVKH